jgi:hypothetical protein
MAKAIETLPRRDFLKTVALATTAAALRAVPMAAGAVPVATGQALPHVTRLAATA